MFVEMTYPANGNTALFPEEAVELWRARDWVPTSELPAPAAESSESTSDPQTPPDPADKKPAKPATRGEKQE